MNRFWNIIDTIARFVMESVLKCLHIEWTSGQWTSFLQFVKFAIIGVSNTVISYTINVVVLLGMESIKVPWDYIVANCTAFILSVLWSFYWNNKYVFKKGERQTRSIGKALLKTYASYAVSGILIANVISWLFISILGISKYIVPLFNLIISVPLNFMLNKLWAFKVEK